MQPAAKQLEIIVQTWQEGGRAALTARLLRHIERALTKEFGANAISPASIARVLADQGAELRHPDIIECDAAWREKKLKQQAGFAGDERTKPLTLQRAEALLRRFETARRELLRKKNKDELRRLRDSALNEKARARLLARDSSVASATRIVQEEIAEWFRVWLETPEIFDDWLQLRRRSPDFIKKFATETQRHGETLS